MTLTCQEEIFLNYKMKFPFISHLNAFIDMKIFMKSFYHDFYLLKLFLRAS